MKIRKFEIALAFGLIAAIAISGFSSMSAFAARCDDIRGSVLRLHILANSDSTADQALKLKVRDKILASSGELFGGAESKKEVMDKISKELPEIQKIAQEEIRREGYSYSVQAKLVHMYFTTRTYGSYTLPAGYYDALRITIGKAQGHNWWCVMFPPLCLPSAEGEETMESVFTPGEQNIVKGSSQPKIKIEFKIVEIYEDIVNWFESL